MQANQPLDLGMVTHQCVCGCTSWNIVAGFTDYEISWYALDMTCYNCGAKAKAPTLVDKDNYEDS